MLRDAGAELPRADAHAATGTGWPRRPARGPDAGGRMKTNMTIRPLRLARPPRPARPPRVWNTLRLLLATLASAVATSAALAMPIPFAERDVHLTAREQPIAAFVQDLFGRLDI